MNLGIECKNRFFLCHQSLIAVAVNFFGFFIPSIPEIMLFFASSDYSEGVSYLFFIKGTVRSRSLK
jgi:hypothetical protein